MQGARRRRRRRRRNDNDFRHEKKRKKVEGKKQNTRRATYNTHTYNTHTYNTHTYNKTTQVVKTKTYLSSHLFGFAYLLLSTPRTTLKKSLHTLTITINDGQLQRRRRELCLNFATIVCK